jgi:hypothetical protein
LPAKTRSAGIRDNLNIADLSTESVIVANDFELAPDVLTHEFGGEVHDRLYHDLMGL